MISAACLLVAAGLAPFLPTSLFSSDDPADRFATDRLATDDEPDAATDLNSEADAVADRSGTDPDDTAEDSAVVEPVQKRSQIQVGSGPTADFSTIAEAVRHAAAGATITVSGPGPYYESIAIRGEQLNGLQLVAESQTAWHSPTADGSRCLTIENVQGVRVSGFQFAIDQPAGRAIQISGDAQDIVISDCDFQHQLDTHKLSLVLVETEPSDSESVVEIRDSRFSAIGNSVMCLALGATNSASRVVCTGCHFEATHTHVYVTEACHVLRLSHCIFQEGHNGVNLSLKAWWPDSQIQIVNNTFVGTQYWIGLMDSFRSSSVPIGPTDSCICNNLILGGQRPLGSDDQWQIALNAWTFAANWWERDYSTKEPPGRPGQFATLHDRLNVPIRKDSADPDYLRPEPESPLLTSGVGGDLPNYIGARSQGP